MRRLIVALVAAASLLALAPAASQAWTYHSNVKWLYERTPPRTLRQWWPNGVIRRVVGYTSSPYAASCVRIVDGFGNPLSPGQGYYGWVCAGQYVQSVTTYDGQAPGIAQFYNGGNFTIDGQAWASYWTNP